MTNNFDPVVRRFIDLLQRVLPHASNEDLYYSYHFLTGALTLTLSDTGRLDRLSDGQRSSSDMDAIAPRMIEYAAAGFRAVCQTRELRTTLSRARVRRARLRPTPARARPAARRSRPRCRGGTAARRPRRSGR